MLLEIWLSQIRRAQEYVEAHELEGLLFLGDLNARHTNWNDSTVNPHGVVPDENLTQVWKSSIKVSPHF